MVIRTFQKLGDVRQPLLPNTHQLSLNPFEAEMDCFRDRTRGSSYDQPKMLRKQNLFGGNESGYYKVAITCHSTPLKLRVDCF